MSNWESEKQLADKLQQLTAQVKELQNEIRGDTLAARTPRSPALPTDDERKTRSMAGDKPTPSEPGETG